MKHNMINDIFCTDYKKFFKEDNLEGFLFYIQSNNISVESLNNTCLIHDLINNNIATNIFNWFLDNNIGVILKNKWNYTPFQIAVIRNNKICAQKLITNELVKNDILCNYNEYVAFILDHNDFYKLFLQLESNESKKLDSQICYKMECIYETSNEKNIMSAILFLRAAGYDVNNLYEIVYGYVV